MPMCYDNFFHHRIIKLWNMLPVNIRELILEDFGNNSTFKKHLAKYYSNMVNTKFDTENLCTWFTLSKCANCRPM